REAVIQLAQGMRIEVMEREITLEELLQADEAFLTNSIIEIVPLVEVDDRPVGGGVAGGVTGKLMTAYKELVGWV
ncbi:aminotransferase class IV, partial [Chloroflexota bacterium]